MKAAIIIFPGSNCDRDLAIAFEKATGNKTKLLWHKDADIPKGIDIIGIPGGFSFGDVLGAGQGWAKSILFNPKTRDQFEEFFHREDTLTLGVCNGCQMLSSIREIIPGTEHWPTFVKNDSEQFEARFLSVSIEKNNSPFFQGMEESILPIAVAHGEGKAQFKDDKALKNAIKTNIISLKYVDNYNKGTLRYPFKLDITQILVLK